VWTGKITKLLSGRNFYWGMNSINFSTTKCRYIARSFNLKENSGRHVIYLKNAVLIAEYQFGDRVPDDCFRHLKNGIVFKNDWPLLKLRWMLTEYYIIQNTATSFDIATGYAVELEHSWR
jgi:hypothetical protein